MNKTSPTRNAARLGYFGRAWKHGIALSCALIAVPAMAQSATPSTTPSAADTTAAAVKIAATVCATCHGVTGVNSGTVFPRLAGQQEMYLAAQLRAFKGKTRGEKEAHD